jgi:hypothetical protein
VLIPNQEVRLSNDGSKVCRSRGRQRSHLRFWIEFRAASSIDGSELLGSRDVEEVIPG